MDGVFRCGYIMKDVGKNLTNTKKMIKWGLMINEQRCVITIKHSLLSGKKVIFCNDKIVKEVKQLIGNQFDYTWAFEKHIFKVDIAKENKSYTYQLSVDEVMFSDLPDFKNKDKIAMENLVDRLKKGPTIPRVEEETVEEIEEEIEYDDEEEAQFFSTQGDDDNWLDFSQPMEATEASEAQETKLMSAEEDLKKKRIAEYTAGIVDLDFGL